MRAISLAKFEEGVVNEDAAIAKENMIVVSDGAGGGGGWYGGGGISTAGCGGGGSGHINTTLIESGSMETGVRQGYGYILITQIRHN